jgi:hypothetical protein
MYCSAVSDKNFIFLSYYLCLMSLDKGKGKVTPLEAWCDPEGG